MTWTTKYAAKAAAAVMLIVSAAACNRDSAPGSKAPGSEYSGMTETFMALSGARGLYDGMAIYSVSPPRGPLTGLNPAALNGSFFIPDNLAEAQAAYSVYFGANFAPYDTNVAQPITDSQIFVTVPPGAALGFVDVVLLDNTTSLPAAELPNGYEYIEFGIAEVDPNIGWIFGFEPVTIRGGFPVSQAFMDTVTALSAANYYYVQFGNRVAQFDPVPDPVITTSEMFVLSPPAENVGFVDVTVGAFDGMGNVIALDALAAAYRYYGMYLLRCVPDQGPLAGGNLVRLEGVFPGLEAISGMYSFYEAEAAYSVYFGANQAPFADMGLNPVFLPSQIDTINQTYTIGYMYVNAPPGDFIGFVDVRVEDDTDLDLPTTLPNGYEYIEDDGISRWDTAEILPNPIGKLLAGELLVRISGIGRIEGTSDIGPAFIVPQGGDPANANHRILLERTSLVQQGSEFTWEGTNIDPIPRIMNLNAPDELLVDGHAAVFLFADGGSGGDLEIVGDSTDPADGGIISPAAQTGRHALIDTIPPRLLARGVSGLFTTIRADELVNPDVASGTYLTTFVPTSLLHPYPLPAFGQHPSAEFDAPFDGRVMTRPYRPASATEPVSAAQMFFNVASISNGFAPENLRFVIDQVIFEDVDIYTMLGREPGVGLNANFFASGDTTRQPAGFPLTPPPALSGLLRDEAFITHPELLVTGQFQSSPFALPEITGIGVQFTPQGPLTGSGALASISPNLAPTPSQLVAQYTVGSAVDPTSGVQLDVDEVYSLIPIVWRAVDRAGDYFPRGDLNQQVRKLWTANDTTVEGYVGPQQPDMGPLNLWWMRTTGTRIVSTVPPSGDARNPSFSWEPTASPSPPGIVVNGEGSTRMYSFAIYRTAVGSIATRDELRDGPYTQIVPWSAWASASNLTNVDDYLAITVGLPLAERQNAWFLIVVMSVDEAGNVEQWPIDQLSINAFDGSATSPNEIIEVFVPGDEDRNWERWWVPPVGESIETIVEPFFWHDTGLPFNGIPNAGESTFADAEVIPYPPRSAFQVPFPVAGAERVAAQFRISLVTSDPDATITYRIVENGNEIALVQNEQQDPAGGFTVNLVLPDPLNLTSTLGVTTRRPTYYTFEAWTVNSDGTQDSSPAAVNFVIVDNVAEFIRNPDETQPIRESDTN